MVCDKDCFHCKYPDCVLDDLDLEDYRQGRELDKQLRDPPPDRKRAAYMRAYRAAHKEKKAAYMRAYRAAHKEEKAAYDQVYRAAHKEEIAAYKRAYCAAHKEEIAAYKRAYYAARKKGAKKK